MNLAVLRLSAMGDVIHTLPLLHVLKKNLREHRILLVTHPRFAPWAGGAPFVDGILPADLASREGRTAALAAIRGAELDCIVDAQGLYKSALLAFFSGAVLRVGFARGACREPLAALFYHRRVRPGGAHVIEKNLSLAAALGCADMTLGDYRLDFLPADPEGRVKKFMEGMTGRPFILFHPFSSRKEKDFPLEPVKALLPRLRERGMALAVSGGPGQEERVRAAAGALSAAAVPLFSIPEMALLIRHAACVIAPDTGFLHIADGLRKPTVSYFTHLPPERNGPFFTPGLAFWRVLPDPGRMRSFLEAL
jgi:heptosyltransferase I